MQLLSHQDQLSTRKPQVIQRTFTVMKFTALFCTFGTSFAAISLVGPYTNHFMQMTHYSALPICVKDCVFAALTTNRPAGCGPNAPNCFCKQQSFLTSIQTCANGACTNTYGRNLEAKPWIGAFCKNVDDWHSTYHGLYDNRGNCVSGC